MAGHVHKLLIAEREQMILQLLRESEVMSVSSLSSRLQISEATVRRDLQSMQERGLLKRVHGGASIVEGMRLDEPVFSDKEALFLEEKRRIAEGASQMICDHDTIYLDGGSTVLTLARMLEVRKDLTIVTNSLMAASLLQESGHHLFLTGGEFRGISRTLVGPLTASILETLTFDKAFMGTIGFSLETGMTTTDANEAYTKRLAMQRSREVFLLADHSKLGAQSFCRCGGVEDLDVLITDEIEEGMRDVLEERGVQVRVV